MERLKSFALCLLPLAFCLSVAQADSADDQFKQGNAAYAAGKFSDAATLYESARQAGLNHWILYYNLANAQYKNGQVGKAIANYYRAFRLNSGNRDVLYNLNLAAARAGDPLIPSSELPALFWRLFFFFSLNTLTLGFSLIFLVIVTAAGLWIAGRRRPSNEEIVTALLVLALTGGWLGVRIYLNERAEGVIVNGVGEVRSGPNTTYAANFTVPEGHRVLVLDEQEPVTGWVEIGVPDQGLKGWVPSTSIEIL